MTRAVFYRIGAVCGFSRREVMLSTPGEIGDAWELYLQANGARKKREDE